MKKIAAYIMIITLVSKLFGFVRDMVLSYYYGASNISDAYLISLTIPFTLFFMLAVAIETTYIPIANQIRKDENDVNSFTSDLIIIVFVISTIFIILSTVFTNQIVRVFAVGFEEETFLLAVSLTKISVFSIYFLGLTYIINGYFRYKEKFVLPTIIGFPLNIVTILFIIMSKKFTIQYLSYGSVLASFAQIVILLPFVLKSDFKFKPNYQFKGQYIHSMLKLSIPVLLGTSVNQINKLVDRSIASNISIGGISALNYSNRITLFFHGVIVLSLVNIMYPIITNLYYDKKTKEFVKVLNENIRMIAILVLPVTAGAILLSEEIISVLFGRGAFNNEAIVMTSSVFQLYALGMLAIAYREMFSKVCYTIGKPMVPIRNAFISMTLNVILNFILSRYLGIPGLALATSIAASVGTLLLYFDIRKSIGSIILNSTIMTIIKSIIATIVMANIVYFFKQFLIGKVSLILEIMLVSVIGVSVYWILSYFMRIEEMKDLFKLSINLIHEKLSMVRGKICKK